MKKGSNSGKSLYFSFYVIFLKYIIDCNNSFDLV